MTTAGPYIHSPLFYYTYTAQDPYGFYQSSLPWGNFTMDRSPPLPPPPPPPVFTRNSYIDPDNRSDRDSCATSTKSVRDSIFNFIRENGRTYHSYQAGSYFFPNDQLEVDRMNLQFEIMKVLFGFRNHFAPLDHPRKILDVGCGSGKWAIEMGHQYPKSEITGTDLSPIQPEWVPNNVKFVIDDAAEDDWMIRPNSYDYIHTRVLNGCFEDFREVIRKSYKYLKPGGWMESQEYMNTLYCDDGTLRADSPFQEWTKMQDEAAMGIGKPLRIGNKLKRWYEQAGFVNVREEVFKVPINAWPRDPQYKLLGKFNETCLLDGLQASSLALFHRYFGWTKDEIEVYLVPVRKSISDRSMHAYHKVFVVWGQKPEDAAQYPPPPMPPQAPPNAF